MTSMSLGSNIRFKRYVIFYKDMPKLFLKAKERSEVRKLIPRRKPINVPLTRKSVIKLLEKEIEETQAYVKSVPTTVNWRGPGGPQAAIEDREQEAKRVEKLKALRDKLREGSKS